MKENESMGLEAEDNGQGVGQTYAHKASILLSKATDDVVNIEASVFKHIVIIYYSVSRGRSFFFRRLQIFLCLSTHNLQQTISLKFSHLEFILFVHIIHRV